MQLIDELQYYLGDEPGLSEEDVEKHNEVRSHQSSLQFHIIIKIPSIIFCKICARNFTNSYTQKAFSDNFTNS